ncbi:MAG: hypothetical protein M5U26_19505 [Planctomycetota bacterium]|nr:hypothetical protein [Planctomycetota bacterium]
MPAPVPPQAAQELAVRAVPCPACGAQEKETAVAGLQGFHDLNSPQRFSFSRCRACALVFLDPRPLNLDEVYLEDYGKHHARGRKAPGLRSYSRRLLHRVFQDYPRRFPRRSERSCAPSGPGAGRSTPPSTGICAYPGPAAGWAASSMSAAAPATRSSSTPTSAGA